MRGKYSPTIVERNADPLWWARNGGGYGLLDDGSQMSDVYHQFDHEGYDRFGYNERGIDRDGNSVRDYEVEELFAEVLTRGLPVRHSKSVTEYWHAVTEVAERIAERFPGLPVVAPQDGRPQTPHIGFYVAENGGYGVRLVLDDVDHSPRSLDIVFDAVDSSRLRDLWSVNVVARSGGETRRTAGQALNREEAMEFARTTTSAYDPDRRLYDVLIVQGGDGVIFLEARQRSERARGDILGTVYASEAAAAIETLARRFEPGGTVQRMAFWGLRRIGAGMPMASAGSRSSAENHDIGGVTLVDDNETGNSAPPAVAARSF
ncbi:hypothetical protein HFO56_01645 [Rhizobium laguerreae]|uniref:hypothetical protein n=1 Tax=Rhizobium laguerreae TaxID=1076926 RepID=UPI001C90C56C|nr:hypothetical protein [Rhizobium laguerreae]MBY3151114.1 hypothetical protein [Rhizobium laguerreae]